MKSLRPKYHEFYFNLNTINYEEKVPGVCICYAVMVSNGISEM